MRSQLDGVDKRLPGSGVFDIKTRAAVPIRLDLLNYEVSSVGLRSSMKLAQLGCPGKFWILDSYAARPDGEL